jgi:hypothetical protein
MWADFMSNFTYADPPQTLMPSWSTNSQRQFDLETTEAAELLCLMEQAAQRTLGTQKLQNLLTWATQTAARSQDPAHPTAKRAAALALALERAIALAHAHARGVDRTSALKLSNTLAHALNHARKIVAKLKQRFHPEMTSEPSPCELSGDFTYHVAQSWFEGQFDPKLIELSQPEAQALNRYLCATEWIVQCFEAQIGISCGAWEAIVDRLIQPS